MSLVAIVDARPADMREAAKRFASETAAKLRDTVRELKTKEILVG